MAFSCNFNNKAAVLDIGMGKSKINCRKEFCQSVTCIIFSVVSKPLVVLFLFKFVHSSFKVLGA